MFYVIPLSFFVYKYRYYIGWYVMWAYSIVEMKCVQTYRALTTETDSEGNPIPPANHLTVQNPSVRNERLGVFEISYTYLKRSYTITHTAEDETKAREVIQYIYLIEKGELPPPRVYRWVDASILGAGADENPDIQDERLAMVRKYSGPFGDFYAFVNYNIPQELYSAVFKDIVLTDNKMDEYRLESDMRLLMTGTTS